MNPYLRMKIGIIGYQTWGKQKGRLYYMGRKALEKGVLRRVICKDSIEKVQQFVIKEPSYLTLFEDVITKVHKFCRDFPARYYNEQVLFDSFAQGLITKDMDAVIFIDSGLVRCVSKAKRQRIITIILHRNLHPQHMFYILKEEEQRFRIKDKSSLNHVKSVLNRIITLKECDKVLALSELEKESLCKYGISCSKIFLLQHGTGVDAEFFKPPKYKENEPFTVLFIGHKSLIKGVPYLLLAWKQLNLKNAKLIIAGQQNKQILRLFKDKISFEAPGEVKPLKYYQKASVFVLPSLGDAFGRAVLEAMSCGLPVIISDMVGAKDIVRDGKEGIIIPSRDFKAIAESIQYFYDNRKEIKRMGKNARETAKKYSWEIFSEEIIKTITELLED